MSASEPGRPPVFEPHLIHFNSPNDPTDGFEYPPDTTTERAAYIGAAVGECWTNGNHYDLLVRAVLLSIYATCETAPAHSEKDDLDGEETERSAN